MDFCPFRFEGNFGFWSSKFVFCYSWAEGAELEKNLCHFQLTPDQTSTASQNSSFLSSSFVTIKLRVLKPLYESQNIHEKYLQLSNNIFLIHNQIIF